MRMENLTRSDCKASHECSQCWSLCLLLQSDLENRRLCLLPDCGVGCRDACMFHSLAQTQAEEQPGGVLAVDWQGVPETPLSRVRTIIQSLGLAADPSYSRLADHHSPASTPVPWGGRWRLRQDTLVARAALVQATVSWDPRQHVVDQLSYLVTWEAQGGVVRGNLLTNNTCVTLSLRPGTIYKVQVSTLEPESVSEVLIVDTHLAPPSPNALLDHPAPGGAQLVGAGAAAVLLLSLTAAWRWRHRLARPHSRLLDEESGTPNLYRVFPPVVRLLGDSQKRSADMFISTDNLLQDN